MGVLGLSLGLMSGAVAPAAAARELQDLIATETSIRSTAQTLQTRQQEWDQAVREFLPRMADYAENSKRAQNVTMHADVAAELEFPGPVKTRGLVASATFVNSKTNLQLTEHFSFFVVQNKTDILLGGHTNRAEPFGGPAHYLYRATRKGGYIAGAFRPGGEKSWRAAPEALGRRHLGETILAWMHLRAAMPAN